MNINTDRFNHELNLLQLGFSAWQEEIAIKATQVLKEAVTIKRQREELIQKSNLIVAQVNGLRGQKEQAELKMLEAQKLRASAVSQLETVETMKAEVSLKENELELREKNIKLLEEREKRLKKEEEIFATEKIAFLHDQTVLKREQELLNEKQQVLVIREKRIAMDEAKQRRILSDI